MTTTSSAVAVFDGGVPVVGEVVWHRYTERRLQAERTLQLEKSHLSPDHRQLHISSALLCHNNILKVTI